MPQFLVLAYDGTDAEAPARRQAARPSHLEKVGPMVAAGAMIAGGALLGPDGSMIGSAMMIEMDSREALDSWLAGDPYTVGGVWQRVEIQAFRLAVQRTPPG